MIFVNNLIMPSIIKGTLVILIMHYLRLNNKLFSIITFLLVLWFSNMSIAGTLKFVLNRGFLQCGISEFNGFAIKSAEQKWSGFEIDLCRAFAASLFSDASKVSFQVVSNQDRFNALQSGDIDILFNHDTWTFTRDLLLNLDFLTPVLYDGQGFLSLDNINIKNDLKTKIKNNKICVTKNTTSMQNLQEYSVLNKLDLQIIESSDGSDMINKFYTKQCEVITDLKISLHILKQKLKTDATYIIWDDVMSKEPISPIIRDNDGEWKDLLQWILFGLISADELEINSMNVDEFSKSTDHNVMELLNAKSIAIENLGLKKDFIFQAIKQVGNYGEIFDNNLGANSIYKIPRNLNQPWNKGGVMYSPVFK